MVIIKFTGLYNIMIVTVKRDDSEMKHKFVHTHTLRGKQAK